ncbi:hypothetical protein ACGF0J_10075 [Nonomuraea sp. NPDC047897]
MDSMIDIFEGVPQVVRRSLVERYSYKKKPGSSDTAKTQDEIIT